MRITWYGHSAFRLDFGGKAVLIDPFFTGNPGFGGDKEAAAKGISHILLNGACRPFFRRHRGRHADLSRQSVRHHRQGGG